METVREHALRSHQYRDSDLLCLLCGGHEDNQENMLICAEIVSRLKTNEVSVRKVQYNDIFEDPFKQKVATALFKKILDIRTMLIDENLGKDQDPSTPSVVLETRLYFQPCIYNLSSGK